MRFTLASFAFAGLLISTAAFADNTQQPAAQQTVVKDKGDEIVCKVLIHEGMTTSRAICHTRKRWDTIRRHTAQAVNDFQLHSFSNPM